MHVTESMTSKLANLVVAKMKAEQRRLEESHQNELVCRDFESLQIFRLADSLVAQMEAEQWLFEESHQDELEHCRLNSSSSFIASLPKCQRRAASLTLQYLWDLTELCGLRLLEVILNYSQRTRIHELHPGNVGIQIGHYSKAYNGLQRDNDDVNLKTCPQPLSPPQRGVFA